MVTKKETGLSGENPRCYGVRTSQIVNTLLTYKTGVKLQSNTDYILQETHFCYRSEKRAHYSRLINRRFCQHRRQVAESGNFQHISQNSQVFKVFYFLIHECYDAKCRQNLLYKCLGDVRVKNVTRSVFTNFTTYHEWLSDFSIFA